ncbi:MAG: hypothetical protein KJ970_12030 [Candidatus Eisenbacteria bacterium]|uniref:Uncharacterized protein n=1 Tax=Eiseniibacteriota bacterium TaxID=2212470 RepID=A0A948W6Z0_UNCEI|nr:hypothetical protein [Candidatus Eisenbacteria bacterium]MBU1947551.1 hypothetical protein [Candidatus Eisenbacteria bacterium]MBU2691645.1 hypothetical protein [Candidatus Eisenbacteria bacterium]
MAEKHTGTTRTTISVPADLKRRMDKVTEPVNWSALACQAFQGKLAEIASKKEKKNMSDVIERLRASKRSSDSECYKDGYAAGQEWAKNRAEARELERLDSLQARLAHEPSYGWNEYFDSDYGSSAYGLGERLYFDLDPEYNGDRSAAKDFWECVVGEKISSDLPDEFIRGFAEGALSIWNEVQGKL